MNVIGEYQVGFYKEDRWGEDFVLGVMVLFTWIC